MAAVLKEHGMSDQVVDYRPMWEELGLDLDSHDVLLGAVGQMYGDAFLTQSNRPEVCALERLLDLPTVLLGRLARR
jgi:hypothetical protein